MALCIGCKNCICYLGVQFCMQVIRKKGAKALATHAVMQGSDNASDSVKFSLKILFSFLLFTSVM